MITPTGVEQADSAGYAQLRTAEGSHTRPARRHTLRAAGACLTALLALTAAACGSSSSKTSTAPTSTGSSRSTGGQTANLSAAKAVIAGYTGHPSPFPVTEPLPKTLPAGAKFAFLQCSTPVCGIIGKLVAPAVTAIGGTLSTVNAGSTAAQLQTAASTVLAQKPSVVIFSGIDPSLFGGALNKLSAAGIKVVSISIPENVSSFGIDFNYMGPASIEKNGTLLADWVVANKGAKANVVFYTVPALQFTIPMGQQFKKELAKNCPSCQVRFAPIDVTTIGTTSPATVVSDLQSHPSTNVAVFSTMEAADGLPAALKAAGLSVTTVGYAPDPSNLQAIKDGGLTAGLAGDFATSIWTAVDASARLLEGSQPTASEQAGASPEQFLTKSDITFNTTNGWIGYPDFAPRFLKLWHPAG